jgi:hypothetical protein
LISSRLVREMDQLNGEDNNRMPYFWGFFIKVQGGSLRTLC